MQLSRFTDYSLRVLFYVATHDERLCTLAEIANYYQISIEHLRKVVHSLAKSGHLETFRGKNGGIRMKMTPEQVNIGDLIAQTEGFGPLINCEQQHCCLTGICSLQGALHQAQRAFMDTLRQYTLAQLLNNEAMKLQLISSDR
ncbi:RrF2 family transcriptional regulator [Marinobacterium arenosum]|uniref:RrF2 family transcriptional regulator n=1 Tax=Marinobacterium arenosum TaxID=2862496 RepID=UPI001C98E3F0|nr:Rrf2 family transcriptional regulator [Marinobacterium arenosum]MBY4677149.1 Rrf2 family transcriptional regulator [Marinobacterium arenosum]